MNRARSLGARRLFLKRIWPTCINQVSRLLAHARRQRGRSRLLQLDSERTNLLIEGEQRRPVELKVGQYPGWQKLAQPVPALRLPPVRRGRQPMTNKQPAALRLYLLSVMDKLLTLTAPVPGPPLLCTGHPNHGQRVFVASQVTVQAQAERAAIASISLHPSVAFVELLRSDDVAVRASLEQRAVEPEAEPAGFIDDVNLKAFPQPRFDPGHKFRGSKTSRWPRRSVVVLSRHHEFLPVDVKPELEHRAALVYLQSSRRGCGGHTVRNGLPFHKAGESTKAHPHLLHAI